MNEDNEYGGYTKISKQFEAKLRDNKTFLEKLLIPDCFTEDSTNTIIDSVRLETKEFPQTIEAHSQAYEHLAKRLEQATEELISKIKPQIKYKQESCPAK